MARAAEQLIGMLFWLRTNAHIAHLQTDSYSEHMALGSFYDAIAGHADSIAEAWMGRKGKRLTAIPVIGTDPTEPVKDLMTARKWIDDNRTAPELSDCEIQNLIDGAIEEIDSTIYKLRFLS